MNIWNREENEFEPLADPGNVSGFISPAQDYKRKSLDISQLMDIDAPNTFFFRKKAGPENASNIREGDLIVVDKSRPVIHKALVLCFNQGNRKVMEVIKKDLQIYLTDHINDPVCINHTDNTWHVWGVVIWVFQCTIIKQHVRTRRL